MNSTGINEISQDPANVKTIGNKIVIDANGSISAYLYTLKGSLVDKSSGKHHIELAASDYRGPAILNLTINGQKDVRKIIL